MRIRVTLVLAILLLALAPVLLAQDGIRLGLSGGVILPMRDYADVAKMGWLGNANLTYFPAASTSLGLRLDGLYGRSDVSFIAGTHEYLGGTANLVFQFGSRSTPNRFYVFGGGGYMRTRTSGPNFGTLAETSPAINAGAGFSLGGRGFAFFTEARYINIYTDGLKPQFLPVTAGFSFGGL
jgi:hypothetical protein